MTVTINDPVDLRDGVWLVEWSSDLGSDTVFYVYVDGDLYAVTQLTWMTFSTSGSTESMVIKVLDEVAGADDPAWGARALMAWYAVAGTDYYLVEEYVASAWTEVQRIVDRGEGYFRWESRVLEDITTHQFRVTAMGTNGNLGTPTSLTILAVRHPNPPNVAFAWDDATQVVTISAA